MGDTDQVSGAPAGGPSAEVDTREIAGRLLDLLGPTVVTNVLAQFNSSGLGAQVNSWLGRGANEPLTIEQIREALGNEKVQDIARSLGLPTDRLLEVLSRDLPHAVDKASTDGALKFGG